MPKYLIKYSMVGYWEDEIEADTLEEAMWHENLDVSDEPMKWGEFSVDSVTELSTGIEYEIVSTYKGVEQPNRFKEKEEKV